MAEKKEIPWMTRIRALEVDKSVRIPIHHRASVKAQTYSYQIEAGRKYAIRTAKNKNSFTVTRLM